MNRVGTVYGQGLYALAKEEGLEQIIMEQLQVLMACFESQPDYLKLLASHDLPKQERTGLLDGFREALLPTYDSADLYSPMDVNYIRQLLDKYPENHMWLVSHWFQPEAETEEFCRLVSSESRIRGLFMGHTHEHQLIPLGPEWGNKVIAQTGNFSYTMSGADTGGFWGFRDLVIEENKAVSCYIMADSDVVLEEGRVHFDGRISQILEYTL